MLPRKAPSRGGKRKDGPFGQVPYKRGPDAIGGLVAGFFRRAGMSRDRFAILGGIWHKEAGAFARHWKLEAVKGPTVHVRVTSSASGQELAIRSKELLKSLNKHFSSPWIKAIRFKVGGSPT
jgi:hypothetical protein